jgi:hypothetical protein
MRHRAAGSSPWLTVVLTMPMVFWDTGVIACSGPGALETIRQSQHIAWSLAGFSFVMIAIATIPLVYRGRVGRLFTLWFLAVIHPGLWMSVNRGDCGFEARSSSLLMTIVDALAVAVMITWPRSGDRKMKKRQGAICGGLVGAIAGIVLVYLELTAGGPFGGDADPVLVAGWSFCSTVIAGAMVGARLCSTHDRPWYRPRFRLGTMMLLLVILAPFLIIVLPVRRYESSVSTLSGFYFLIVDKETCQPIANATVRLIDPRYKADEQQNAVITQADGHAELYLFANVSGRVGLLYQTETFSYDPMVLQVEAPNYEPFRAPLSDDTSPRSVAFWDRSLGLAFPPPPWAVVGLRRKAASQGQGSDPYVQNPRGIRERRDLD